MYSHEEMDRWPLAFFEEGYHPYLQPGLVEDIKLLAMEDVQLVFTAEGELPVIGIA